MRKTKSIPLKSKMVVELPIVGFFVECCTPTLIRLNTQLVIVRISRPSDKKLGRATLNVYLSLVSSKTITNYFYPFCCFFPFIISREAHLTFQFSVFSFQFSVFSFQFVKRLSLLTVTNYSLLITNYNNYIRVSL